MDFLAFFVACFAVLLAVSTALLTGALIVRVREGDGWTRMTK